MCDSVQQQQEGGDQQVVNPEFDGNVFDSEDYSILFDPEHPFQVTQQFDL